MECLARGPARWAAGMALAAMAFGAARPAAAESDAAAPPGAGQHGAGTLELRLQTATNVAIGGQLAFAAAPGIAYEPDEKAFLVNAVGGVGYFLTPAFAIGLDASYARFADEATFVAVAPFAKLVSGFARWRIGAFVELSPGLLLAKTDGDAGTYVQLTAWGGFHIPLTDTLALAGGPSVTVLRRTDKPEPNDVILGERFGLSVYLPSGSPTAAEQRPLGKGTFELRFQTATHALTGGLLGPQAAHSALYSTDTQLFIFNAIGGGGIFLSDAFAFGGEFSSTLVASADGRATAQLAGLTGFVKLVSGMASWSPGVFVEASPGLFALVQNGGTARARRGAFSQLSLWGGAHLPLGSSTAFVIGPSVTRLDDVKALGDGFWILGARLGLSLYMPAKRRAK